MYIARGSNRQQPLLFHTLAALGWRAQVGTRFCERRAGLLQALDFHSILRAEEHGQIRWRPFTRGEIYSLWLFLSQLWLKLWMNALFEACRSTYSKADLNAILFVPTAWALIKLWMNAIFEYQLHELWFKQQLTLKLIWMQFSNTNCMSSKTLNEWYFRIPTAWALICTAA